MTYCIEIERGGIGEEDIVLHHDFTTEPTEEDVEKIVEEEDIGYQKEYCRIRFYRV